MFNDENCNFIKGYNFLNKIKKSLFSFAPPPQQSIRESECC